MSTGRQFSSVGHDFARNDAGYVLPRPAGSCAVSADTGRAVEQSGDELGGCLVRLCPEGVVIV